jgi:voltage-gated potassium channel
MDLLAGSDCEVEEFRLSDNREDLGNLAGASLAEVQLGRRTGAMVLAILPPTTELANDSPRHLIANPASDVRLAPGQMLVVMGSKDQLDRVGELLGRALIGIDHMAG